MRRRLDAQQNQHLHIEQKIAAAASIRMRSVKQHDTKPELDLRRALHSLGYRFRLHPPDLPGRPDIVLPKWKSVIFVHGCYWHRHRDCPRATMPKRNQPFWSNKFSANRERDARKAHDLEELGWKVLVSWECDVEANALGEAMRISNEIQFESTTKPNSARAEQTWRAA